MKAAVEGNFRKINRAWEGTEYGMYLDVRGLVTTGVGNLIEPSREALVLPWYDTAGEAATEAEVLAEWQYVKGAQHLAKLGAKEARRVTRLRTTDAAIGELCRFRMRENERRIVKDMAFATWDFWPADAQVAVHSMAWALGAGGVLKFGKFLLAASRADFKGMAAECQISEVGNPGIVPRNVSNKVMLLNAAKVVERKLDPHILYWPEVL